MWELINIHPSQEIVTLNLMAGYYIIIFLLIVPYNFMDFNIITELEIYLKRMKFVKIAISNLDQYGFFFKLATIVTLHSCF